MSHDTAPREKEIRVFIITQDEPFFLASAVAYLLQILPQGVSVAGAYVLNGSPFGAKKSFVQRARETAQIFGLRFFLFYALKFTISKVFQKSVADVLQTKVPFVRTGPIPINSEESLTEIRSFAPDIIISLASNQIFKRPLLDLPRLACLNLHTAMLPKYRGLMPLFWAMANGDTEVGVTVFEMDEGLDSGPIVRQAELPIAQYSMYALIKQTKYLGMLLMARALGDYLNANVTYAPNDDAQATRVKFPTREDANTFVSSGRKYF